MAKMTQRIIDLLGNLFSFETFFIPEYMTRIELIIQSMGFCGNDHIR